MKFFHLLVTLALSLPCSAQTTWFVDAQGASPGAGTSTDPFSSIAFALEQLTTVDGDTVQVAAGTYLESIDFLGKAVRVVGIGMPTIDAGGAASVVSFVDREGPDSVLDGFELTGGAAARGGGVCIVLAAPSIRNCVIRVNTARQGGGVWSSEGHPRFEGCLIESNVAGDGSDYGDGGGVAVLDGRLDLLDCVLRANVGEDGGGLHLLDARADLIGTILEDNEARDDSAHCLGGGAYLDLQSRLILTDDCMVRGNHSQNSGAGIYADGILQIQDSVIDGNLAGFNTQRCTSGSGGGIAAGADATLVLLDTILSNNDGCFDGGGLALRTGCAESVRVERCILTENRAQFGGGIFEGGTLGAGSTVVRETELLRNHATSISGTSDFGGGVFGPVTLEACLLEGNTASADGGGANGATLIDCDIIDNVVFDSSPMTSFGGGLFGGSAVSSRFLGNRAEGYYGPGYGGAAYASGLTDCVLVGNRADFGAGAAASTLRNCTLLDNEAAVGGGGTFGGTLINSIARANAPDQLAGASSSSYSNIEGGSGGPGDFDGNPLFWNQDGGDLNLAAGSPCIDSGDPNGPPDADGSRADVGAFDFDPAYCPGPTTYCVSKLSAAACLPSISTSGTPGASGPDDFHLIVTDVAPGRPGLFIIGRARADAPLLGGRLCVGDFVRRPSVTSTGAGTCGGVFDDFVLYADLAARGFAPGDCLSAQLWYRDSAHADGTGSGLSNGVSFALLP